MSIQGLTSSDLQFRQLPITMCSSCGPKFTRWVDIGMPKIDPEVLNCVFYLYESREDAEKGMQFGGTGFFVGVPSERFQQYNHIYVYRITNWHVALEGGCSVIRYHTPDGQIRIIELAPTDWDFPARKDDIAISPELDIDNVTVIPISMFASDQIIKERDIGVGDDVFMVGRFIDYDGSETKMPTVRFGNISLMPAPIKQPTGFIGESYCLDMRSRSGYSGSPVFVFRTPTSNLDEIMRTEQKVFFSSKKAMVYLLGIHWGQFREKCEIVSDKEISLAEKHNFITEGSYIKVLSGMTCVIPCQKILDLMNMASLKEQRKIRDDNMEQYYQEHGFPPEPEIAKRSIPDTANPQHKEDFNSLVSAAAKKKPQDD